MSPRLLRAYRDTTYLTAGITVRIGRRVPDRLFARVDARVAVLVTAWNPRSRRMPDGWNRRRQRCLRRWLRRFAVLDAEGSLHRWREPMLLVAGDPRPLIRIAARFRQHAVVVLRRGQKARLRYNLAWRGLGHDSPDRCDRWHSTGDGISSRTSDFRSSSIASLRHLPAKLWCAA
jgi:hypothetical protein